VLILKTKTHHSQEVEDITKVRKGGNAGFQLWCSVGWVYLCDCTV